MTLHLHDYARALNNERTVAGDPLADDRAPLVQRSVRELVGTTLIRAGTRLLPRAAEPRRVQTSPPC